MGWRMKMDIPVEETFRGRGEEIPSPVKAEDPARVKPYEHVGLQPQQEQGFLKQYHNWLHQPTEPPTGVSDFVNRVMPTSLSKTAVGTVEFPYYLAKSFYDPIVNQGIIGHDVKGMAKGLGKAVVNNLKGIGEFFGEPMGLYGQEKANERWSTDPFGSLLAISSMGEGAHGTAAHPPKGLEPAMQKAMKPLMNERGQIEIADTPYGEVKVLVNPTREAIEGYWKNPMRAGNSKDILGMFHDTEHGPLKFLDDGKNIYIWDAFESTHRDLERYYGIAPVGKGEFFRPDQFNIERRGR
jgi:hypothetical protein